MISVYLLLDFILVQIQNFVYSGDYFTSSKIHHTDYQTLTLTWDKYGAIL